MREILFRGKRIDNGEWITGDYEHFYLSDGELVVYISEWGERSNKVLPETVGQFTGLIDKNGKKIFEGDIVEYQYPLHNGEYKPFRAEVKAGVKSFGAYHCVYGFCAYLEFGEIEISEVIGNIHDNPELLEGGER